MSKSNAAIDDVLRKFNASRDFSNKAFHSVCYAPFTSLYFDWAGYAVVCCQNKKYVVGNVETDTLRDIWHGPRIRALRTAILKDNFKLGCDHCSLQFDLGNSDGTFIKTFDPLPADSTNPEFPTQLEFSISNTCNLECVQCRGEWSSSIRARREKLPPIRKVYGERFFEELREFLPHLTSAKYYGGEPFLQQECYRIWDMTIEMGLQIRGIVTTNGTQFNAKVERILDKLPFDFAMSFDGATKETVEKIRVNADYDEVLANFHRFLGYARRWKTTVSLTYCLMRMNWWEFGDFLLFADSHGCCVFVNVVVEPLDYSLYTLDPDLLWPIVKEFEASNDRLVARLTINRETWVNELHRLRQHAEKADRKNLYFLAKQRPLLPVLSSADVTSPPISDESFERIARLRLAALTRDGSIDCLSLGADGKVMSSVTTTQKFLELDSSDLVGLDAAEIDRKLHRLHGENVGEWLEHRTGGLVTRNFTHHAPTAVAYDVLLKAYPKVNALGEMVGTEILAVGRLIIPVRGVIPHYVTRQKSLALSFPDQPTPCKWIESDALYSSVNSALKEAGDKRLASFTIDLENLVTSIIDQDNVEVASALVIGRSHEEAGPTFINHFGPKIDVLFDDRQTLYNQLIYRFSFPDGPVTIIRTVTSPRFDADGLVIGATQFWSVSENSSPLTNLPQQ